MEDLNIEFNNYIEEVKKLSVEEKREELINSILHLISVFDTLAKEENIRLNYLTNREILDINKENVSEDDFLEAALVYLEMAKNIVGDYSYNINNNNEQM